VRKGALWLLAKSHATNKTAAASCNPLGRHNCHPEEVSFMTASVSMTIQLRPDVKEKLDRIAADTQQSMAILAGEAVAAYVDCELAIVDSIKRGMTDAALGRTVTHDEAITEIDGVLDAVQAHRLATM
jgi:predicted transcriptional regulator